MTPETLIDVGSPETWPKSLTTAIARLDRHIPSTRYPSALEIGRHEASDVWAALANSQLSARHFTRLLPHEFESIRATGLRVFSRTLFDERIDAAAAHGHFNTTTTQALKSVSIPAAEAGARGDRDFVCLTIGPVAEQSPHSVAPLIETWGGEGIYFASGARPYKQLLQGLGRPAAVLASLSLADRSTLRFWPPIEQLLLGRFRDLSDNYGDVFSREAISSSAIIGFEMLD